jgi:hypothetical protein
MDRHMEERRKMMPEEKRKMLGMNQFGYNTYIHGNIIMKLPV